MRLKRLFCVLIALVIMLSSVSTYGAFLDVDKNNSYSEAIERIAALGIIKGMGDGNFEPNSFITREQFATLIVKAAGFEDTAKNMNGSTIFPDVDPFGWAVGYINMALNKGYVTGMTDGKFHPEESVTFAQACTILVRALGYTDQDISGLWPKNYIDKAYTLGLTPDITLSGNNQLPRWAAAVMIDRLLITPVKSTTGTAKTFSDSTGLYVESIVLSDSSISTKLQSNQVLTDKGTYYIGSSDIKLEVGYNYKLVIKDNKIVNAYKIIKPMLAISVESAVDTNITYKSSGKLESMTLPENAVYYYQGVKTTYANLKNSIQGRSSIILAYNDDKSGFEYGVIIDPVYSKPQIVSGYGIDAKLSGGMDIKGCTIVKEGEVIGIGDLEDKDIVYSISDIWNLNKYILVVSNKVEGKITGILPNKFAPRTLQVDSKSYEIGNYFNITKVNTTPGSFTIGDAVTLLLGSDGNVVDIMDIDAQDNSSFAFVVNTGYTISDAIGDYGKILYNVKLKLIDGSLATYRVDNQAADFKGKLVKYQRLDDERVYLEKVEYIDPVEHMISTDQRMLDNAYVAENVKIFNLLSNDTGIDAQVELIDWDEMPRGMVQANKVNFINKTGAFEDINIMVLNDFYDQKYKLGVVKSISGGKSSNTYTLLIDGKEYSCSGPVIANVTKGSVFKVKMVNGKVDSLVEFMSPEIESQTVSAVDSKRIKIYDKVYWFKDGASIYKKDSEGTIISIGTGEIDLALTYGKVSVYYDKSPYYGGKVDMVVLSE